MKNSNNLKKSVCIIGAGVSGMTCAHLLKETNLEVFILEASDRYGGRIRGLKGFCEREIELGGEEIHGNNTHYYKLALEAGAEIFGYWEENTFYTNYKGEFKEIEKLSEKYPDLKFVWDLFEEVSYLRGKDYPDIPIKEYLKQNNISDDLDFLANAMFAVECGTDMGKLSIKGFSDLCKKWQAGDENYMINKLSHTDIITKSYKDIINSIEFNKEIKKVLYEDEKVTLIDQNNSSYSYDYCIITVPVTQIKKIIFQPVLPKDRIEAFDKINLDNIAKLVLKFKKQFWADDCSWLLIPGSINVFWPVTQGMKTNESILTGMVSGKQSLELNKLYQEDKQKFIDSILNDIEMYCKCKVKDDLVDFYWFDWKSVPFIEGGYSFPSVNEGNSRDIIREPLHNKLFFAGEAYARNGHIATIHGAIETAHEAVKLLTNLL